MISILDLWMPIAVSSVVVFFASFILHMVLTYHRADYKPLPRDYENRISVPLKTLLEYPGLPQDKLALARREYLAAGARPSHTRYGWVHTG